MGAFARAALAGAFGVLALSLMMPGVTVAGAGAALMAFALAASVAGIMIRRHYPYDRLGLCNLVTLVRLVLVGALVAALLSGVGPSWAVFAVAAIALSLDGLDGWLARRQGLASEFGARFDMEVDSAFALVLALNAAVGPDTGWAVVVLGLPRYLFGAAGYALPWIRRDLPARFSRKTVCVLQLAVLIVLQVPVTLPLLTTVLVPLVAGLLVWSFVKDAMWLWRHRA